MRLAVDTNVLVRYLVWDDETQSKRAAKAIEAEQLIVSTIVLCETVWVLRRVYKRPADDIAAVLRRLAETENIEVDRVAVEAGVTALESGGDFADGVILYEAGKAKADMLVTFDKSFAKQGKLTKVKRL